MNGVVLATLMSGGMFLLVTAVVLLYVHFTPDPREKKDEAEPPRK